MKCCTPRTPCSTLMSSRAIPHRSLGPNATRRGKDLLTPSLLRIACTARHCILFRVLMSNVVTGRSTSLTGVRASVENECIHFAHDVDNLIAYRLALFSRNSPSFRIISIRSRSYPKSSSCLPHLEPWNHLIVRNISGG